MPETTNTGHRETDQAGTLVCMCPKPAERGLGLTSLILQARTLSKACAGIMTPPKLSLQSLKAIIMTQASSLKVLAR